MPENPQWAVPAPELGCSSRCCFYPPSPPFSFSYLQLSASTSSSLPFNPLPVSPIGDVQGRIAELQAKIDDPATSESQKINLQTVIKLYHDKELPGRLKWIQDGKVVQLKDIDFHRPHWTEGHLQQISTQAMIPATKPDPSSEPP
ncbi:hypothetical protein I7I51_09050 [Histoplasma capsulatum]|uniref:Uncharacterized protein n=1 Tax=Ajellomyces capsulatus TaxID=5037 RepID=A0A8A1M4N6_AJECA|nr:hypothetical protein I7I51_09050 [Histoplasma capsulatum]